MRTGTALAFPKAPYTCGHPRITALYTTLPKAQKDPVATLPESSAQQNSPHEQPPGRSCGTFHRTSG
ncbi:hypothetical protein SGPA1_60058 [Streptomyces misionensis JCM 4497]